MIGSLIDNVLDRTVLPGYTRLGYELRRRLWHDGDLAGMAGRRVLVTGGTSGIGLAAAEGFAALGARVVIVGRDPRRAERARAQIEASTGSELVEYVNCHLGEMSSVRALAERVSAAGGKLDVLVNNAGVMLSARELSSEGIEMTFATNVLGPFLLTQLLVDDLAASGDGRIVNVSSGGMYTQRLDVGGLQMEEEGYDGTTAYARSKRAEVVLSELWAERLAGLTVGVHAMHPGWADTPGLKESLPGFRTITKPLLRSAAEGADTIVWLGAAPAGRLGSGSFWHDRRRRPTHRVPWTHESRDERARLWSMCERLSSRLEHGTSV